MPGDPRPPGTQGAQRALGTQKTLKKLRVFSGLAAGLKIWCPRQDSNLRPRLRRAVLYPLSYGGSSSNRLALTRTQPAPPWLAAKAAPAPAGPPPAPPYRATKVAADLTWAEPTLGFVPHFTYELFEDVL